MVVNSNANAVALRGAVIVNRMKSKFTATGRHTCKKKTRQKLFKRIQNAAINSPSDLKKTQPNRIIDLNIWECLKLFGIGMHVFAERELFTMATVLLHTIAIAAGIFTTVIPTSILTDDEESIMHNETSNLVVCIPENSTSCVRYVNSSKNGLIELNVSLYPALKTFNNEYDYRLIARINPFWLKFEPPTEAYYNTMAVLYMIIFFIGTTGNGLVIYMFARCKALRTSPYMLVLNLAISDFMIVFKCPLAAVNNYMRGPVLGDWGCRMYGFVGGLSGTASIGMLTIIALDRYSVVVNPLNPNRINYNTRYYAFWIIFVWCYAFFFSSVPLAEIGLSRYVPEGYFTTCSFDYLDNTTEARTFMFVFFIFAWLIPLSVICFCYFHILNVVFKARGSIQSNKNKQKIEIRLAIIVLLVILLWFMAWTPYSIVAICGIFGNEEYLTPTRAMIPALFCKSASCFNPFLYTISHKRFRHELQRLFCNRKPIIHYSTTRSSYLTKSSRRHRQIEIPRDKSALGLSEGVGGGSVRCHDTAGGGSFYHQRQYTFRRNIRSASTPDGMLVADNDIRTYGRPTAVEEDLNSYVARSTSSNRSIVAGTQGSGVFVIDARPSATPDEDVIFIVSGRSSSIRQSISTQVFVISSDIDDTAAAANVANPSNTNRLETSF